MKLDTIEAAEEFLAAPGRRRRVERDELAVNSVVGAEVCGVSRKNFESAKKIAGIKLRRCFVGPVLEVLRCPDFTPALAADPQAIQTFRQRHGLGNE
jgi:hypothetical protein